MNHFKTLLIGLLATFSLAVQADAILIRGASVHTMSADGILENTDIFISGGKIQRIGKDLPVPQDDVAVFNAEGKPVTPGFFAGITSIGITEVSAVEESSDSALALQEMRPEFDVVPAYQPQLQPGSGDPYRGFQLSHCWVQTRRARFLVGRGNWSCLTAAMRVLSASPFCLSAWAGMPAA